MSLQKHEREALAAARAVLGDGVVFERRRRWGQLAFGQATCKVALTSHCHSAAQQARRWALNLSGGSK